MVGTILRRAALAGLLLPAAASGCASRQPETRPETGRLTVGVSTDSGSAQPLRVAVDGESSPVRDGGIITINQLAPGDHQLRLDGLPAGCTVEGGTTRVVTIRAQRTAAVHFAVHCR